MRFPGRITSPCLLKRGGIMVDGLFALGARIRLGFFDLGVLLEGLSLWEAHRQNRKESHQKSLHEFRSHRHLE